MSGAERALAHVLELPGLRQWRRRRYWRLFAARPDANLFWGVYRSFAEAAAAAPPAAPVGYDNPGPAGMYREVLDQVNPRDYPVLYWLRRLAEDGARTVFDYGGHVGVKFYAFQRYLAGRAPQAWTVCDVDRVVEAGRALAGERGAAGLSFTTHFESAAEADVFLAMGSPQYVERPLAAALGGLRRRPPHLLLNGIPLIDGPAVVTLQNIATAVCPYHVFNRAEFVGALQALGYELVDGWANPEKQLRIPFHAQPVVAAYSGLYLRLPVAGRG